MLLANYGQKTNKWSFVSTIPGMMTLGVSLIILVLVVNGIYLFIKYRRLMLMVLVITARINNTAATQYRTCVRYQAQMTRLQQLIMNGETYLAPLYESKVEECSREPQSGLFTPVEGRLYSNTATRDHVTLGTTAQGSSSVARQTSIFDQTGRDVSPLALEMQIIQYVPCIFLAVVGLITLITLSICFKIQNKTLNCIEGRNNHATRVYTW